MSDLVKPKEVNKNHRLIDVRTPREFGAAFIEGAENIPLNELKERCSGLAEQKNLVLVCASGTRAKTAQSILKDRNISCSILEGGINAWLRSGQPVVKGASSGGLSIERQVRIIAGSMAAAGGGLALWLNPWFSLIPILVGLGLIHAGVTDQCLMALILSRLPYNTGKASCGCAAKEE